MKIAWKRLIWPVLLVSFFIVHVPVPSDAASAAEGKRIFDSRGCGGCHALRRTAVMGKGPALWYAGSKFRKGFLEGWLQSPDPIRPMAYGSITETNTSDHPALSAKQARDVAAYLMGLGAGLVKQGIIRPSRSVKGRIIFEKKLGCYGCHRIRKGRRTVGGLSGPSLVGAGERLNPDWIYAFLKDTRRFEPLSAMPVYNGLVSEEELRTLAGYVSSLK